MRIINIKRILKKINEKIWELKLKNKYFYKISEKHVETIRNIKMLK